MSELMKDARDWFTAQEQQEEKQCYVFPGNNAPGLTKREYFAAMAMQTLVANTNKELSTQALLAVSAADALIKELNDE